jgi:nucleoid-associated protein YgaU
MQDLVTQALKQGQSDAYIDALINEAAATGSIAVPSALRTEAGRVDTATLLAALVRKSNPEAAITPTIDTNSNGVEVRVVQRAGETKRYNFYTVQSGDSLGAIAHRFYGDAAFYTSIFDANRQILSSPDRVRAGQRLSIPEITSG